MARTRAHPTRAELAILRTLWKEGPRSVRDVQRLLNASRPTGYTTVLKTMQIMAQKGLVERDDRVRPQIYRARYSQDRTQKQLLRDFIQRAYGGSVKTLVLHAIGTRKPTAEELDAVERFLARFDGETE